MTAFASLCTAAVIAMTAFAAPAHAQRYPNRIITIVVPTAAGGGNDVMARILAGKLQERLKQPVIVDNKAGANGAIAAQHVAKAAEQGADVVTNSPAEFGKFVQSEVTRWAAFIKSAKITAD